MKDTLFLELDPSKEDDPSTEVDFSLLSQMFCRDQEEVKAEEEKRKAAEEKQLKQAVKMVLDPKQIQDTAMSMASLRMSPSDIV